MRLADAEGARDELDVEALELERAATLAAFRDGQRSPYAAVDRRDFEGRPLTLGAGDIGAAAQSLHLALPSALGKGPGLRRSS